MRNFEPYVVGLIGHDTDTEYQCGLLREKIGKPGEWSPIMLSDKDGPCEVVGLCTPSVAPLFAAAPDMLEALQTLEKTIRDMHKRKGSLVIDLVQGMVLYEPWQAAVAVIAKVTGDDHVNHPMYD